MITYLFDMKEDDLDAFWSNIRSKIREGGYRMTSQRRYILDIFLKLGGHVSAEDIFEEIKRKKRSQKGRRNIGLATIYRTLRILKSLGVVSERNFGDGRVRYEFLSDHHDHIICRECGVTMEFSDPEIEERQKHIAREHGFILLSHRHELVGICSCCQKKKSETG